MTRKIENLLLSGSQGAERPSKTDLSGHKGKGRSALRPTQNNRAPAVSGKHRMRVRLEEGRNRLSRWPPAPAKTLCPRADGSIWPFPPYV